MTMNMEIERKNALYFVGWDNLNKMMSDIEESRKSMDSESLRNQLCAASSFVESLSPVITDVETDDAARNTIQSSIDSIEKSTDTLDVYTGLVAVRAFMQYRWKNIDPSVKQDDGIKERIDKLSVDSAETCRYVPKSDNQLARVPSVIGKRRGMMNQFGKDFNF